MNAEIREVFDGREWERAGFDQPDGNEQFWHPATILSTSLTEYGEEIATVRFHHDGRVSRGHFVRCFRGPREETG
jgi:hypothetical protein